MPTGGDGTAYYGEEVIDEKVMTKKDIKKRDEIADAISTKDMKDRYGDKNVKYAIATKIVMDKKKKKKEEMKEELDEKDKPFVKIFDYITHICFFQIHLLTHICSSISTSWHLSYSSRYSLITILIYNSRTVISIL